MHRNPELYSAERDALAREAGLVYIEDFALSAIMIALKARCEPVGMGKKYAQPVHPQHGLVLHGELGVAIARAEGGAGQSISEHNNIDVVVHKDSFDGKVVVAVDYWHGRPLKATFEGGENVDAKALTGFEPFKPDRFDTHQGKGTAQRIVDELRESPSVVEYFISGREADPEASRPEWPPEEHEGPYMGFASQKEAAANGHFRGADGILYYGWDDIGQYDF